MIRLSAFLLILLLACPVAVQAQVQAQAQDDVPLKLGAHGKSGNLDVKKLKQAIQRNRNFGKMNGMKMRSNPYGENFDGKAVGTKSGKMPTLNTTFGVHAPKNKYSDVKFMPQPKGLKDISCFGAQNADKC